MSNQFRIYPYKMGSRSASLLAEKLREQGARCFKVYPDRGYRPHQNHLVVNWGSSVTPNWMRQAYQIRGSIETFHVSVLNRPSALALASNKLEAFRILDTEVPIPEFTTDQDVVREWLADGVNVFARTKLQGHSGQGIVHSFTMENIPRAPLYVKYMKKKHEYRVHVFRGRVIDVQQKKKRRDITNDDVDYQVRNHHNGWVYCRGGVEVSDAIQRDCIRAVDLLGLDFGAVDVIYNEHHNQHYILEVNTAPGLEGTTVDKYVQAILEV